VESGSGLLGGLAPGSRVAGYLLEEQVGVGEMAVVFRAVDERLGRQVALKVLAPALASDESFRLRFIRESRAAAAVDDPHIVPVYEAGEAGGVLFIAMRYVAGGDVHTLLRREGPLPPDRVATIISPVASALDAAHAAGLVHRDVKPTNMLLDARPGRPDHVYLTGQAPFRRDEANAVIWSHLSVPPPPLASLRPGLPTGADQSTPIHQSTPAATPVSTPASSPAGTTAPLAQLLPADIPVSSCFNDNPANYNFAIVGAQQVYDCQSGNWQVTGFQMDSHADYMTTLQNFRAARRWATARGGPCPGATSTSPRRAARRWSAGRITAADRPSRRTPGSSPPRTRSSGPPATPARHGPNSTPGGKPTRRRRPPPARRQCRDLHATLGGGGI
jgi:hypothetical protein